MGAWNAGRRAKSAIHRDRSPGGERSGEKASAMRCATPPQPVPVIRVTAGGGFRRPPMATLLGYRAGSAGRSGLHVHRADEHELIDGFYFVGSSPANRLRTGAAVSGLNPPRRLRASSGLRGRIRPWRRGSAVTFATPRRSAGASRALPPTAHAEYAPAWRRRPAARGQRGRRYAIGCVALEITQRCNLDCTLCYLSESSEAVKDLPLEEVFRRSTCQYATRARARAPRR
jgi:hypothetical protein